ncbi:MAG: hypothetical protein IKL82_02595 [Clostridia bacterium]|nr:hypothetical protein [Clostridia bacterium]
MTHIFAKLIKNQRTIKSFTYKNVKPYESSDFYFHLTTICRELEIETPVVINYHRESYESFNSVKFFKDDFIDKVNFDFLYLENVEE